MELFWKKMLVVFLTFFISAHSLPVFQYGAPQAGDYYIAVDPYATDPYAAAYPSADSYYPAGGYPSLDSYYPSQQYSSDSYYQSPQPYPSDSYYPSVDSYYPAQQQYPSLDSYYQSPQPYQSVDAYQPYPAADPYYQQQPYQSLDSYYQPQPYPSVDPYASLGYQPQPYQDPYAYQPQPYPSVDPYASLGYPQQAPYPSADPYASLSYQPQPYPDPYSYQQPQPYPSVDQYAPYPQQSPQYYPSPQPSPYPQIASAYPDPYSSPYPSALAPASSYAVAPVYNSPQYPPQQAPYQEVDTYLAITTHDIETRKHCGVIAALNDAIYPPSTPGAVNDVIPYGGHPWLRFIVDESVYKVACLGVAINAGLILTAASCIEGPASQYSVMSDWDILTIYNQYEAYKSWTTPVCAMFPLGVDNSTSQAQFVLGGEYAELTLLMTNEEDTNDKYPKDKVVCLPSATSFLNSYNSYPPPSPYGYPPQPPQYGGGGLGSDRGSVNGMSKGECWVAGWHSSPTAVLQNHPNPAPADGQQPPSFNNNQQFYQTLDNSRVPRGALVRQISCPPGYQNPGGDDVCFVGVQGYDACVADKGTGVYCVISDSKPYQSGFADDATSDHGNVLPGNTQPNYPPYQPQGQKQPIQANPAQQKVAKLRVVLYGIVKTITSCSANNAQQSNYVVASRINPSIRAAIADLNWGEAFDGACPSEQVDPVIPLLDPNAPGTGTYTPPYPASAYPSTSLQPQLYDPSIYGDPYAQPQYPQPGYPQPSPYTPSTSYPQPGYPQPAPYPSPAPYPQPGYPAPYPDVSYNSNPLYNPPQQQYQPQYPPQYPQDPMYGIV